VIYNKDQWISSFEDAMVKLRPHMGLRVLTTIGLMVWNQKGTKGVDPGARCSRVVSVDGQGEVIDSSLLRQWKQAAFRPPPIFRHPKSTLSRT
jgi:hypothetical protein